MSLKGGDEFSQGWENCLLGSVAAEETTCWGDSNKGTEGTSSLFFLQPCHLQHLLLAEPVDPAGKQKWAAESQLQHYRLFNSLTLEDNNITGVICFRQYLCYSLDPYI
jgi:hypothetical protein